MEDDVYDRLVTAIYRAASGACTWADTLADIATALDAWAVQLMGWDKRTGRLTFSHYGGTASPAASLGYIVSYHTQDPRVQLLMERPFGAWVHCDEHFDDAFVARSPFYQDFLLPHGGRYVSGTKIFENEESLAVFSSMRGVGKPPHDAAERSLLARLAPHLTNAVAAYRHLRAALEEMGAGRELLDRFAYPMLLVDELSGIRFRNTAAKTALATGDYILERSGVLTCCDGPSHTEFMAAIQDMGLQGAGHAAPDHRGRRYVRIRRLSGEAPIIANLVALRPQATMSAFANATVALVLFHDPAAGRELDPFLVAAMFDLTPAEARVAVALRRGESAQDIADAHRLSLATVRSQIQSIFVKTGVNRQPDLVRLLEGLAGFGTLAR